MSKVKITADISKACDEALELIKSKTGISKSKMIDNALINYLLESSSDDPIINRDNFQQILRNNDSAH